MYQWYNRMTAAIKWGSQVSSVMPVQRGTRQGGLTSPLLFNVFYKELIERLDSLNCGVTIKNQHYNCFAYADDVLLASTTPTGLQRLIDEAVSTISSNGLRFNPSKTLCMTFGHSTFTTNPCWTITGSPLAQENSITYLGASRCND
jgi:retron-type reverse transcriptase